MDLDCHSCNDGIKLMRGCYKEVESTDFEFEGEVLKRCPLKLVTNVSRRFLRFFQFMEKGFLPNPGGILDQPNRFLEAMSILNDTVAKVQEDQRKESEVRNSHLKSGRR